MKREDQSKLMIEKIMSSAVKEFNIHGYDSASMNRICADGKISKGIIYHYFKDKDELYLKCIQDCYQTLADYYASQQFHELDIEDGFKAYMNVRMKFFEEHPEFRGLFFNALLKTPITLRKQVTEARKTIDDFNLSFYEAILSKSTLRNSLSLKQAIKYLDMQQTAFNDYFRKEAEEQEDFQTVINKHEDMLNEWIDIVLYGIVKEK